MLAKEEAGMDIDHREEGLRQSVCRRKRRVVYESDFVYQRRRRRENGSSKKKGSHSQELLWNCRLVKIELDVAQALADFSRLAHLPGHHCPSDLKWFQRRKRTSRSAQKVETKDAHVSMNICVPSSELRPSELDSTTSLSHGYKASPLINSRAESPSSPLPSSKLACRTFLVGGGFASKLPIERAVSPESMQKLIKTEMEDLKSNSSLMSSPARQSSIGLKSQVSLCSVKEEFSDQLLNSTGTEANVASQVVESKHDMGLVVLNRTRASLTEDDKEARRLRRIQANRESARQTIRKKQILCEELRRQSASLALENEGMKQRREMMMQELCFLRSQNYHLKAQLELGASSHLGSHEIPSQVVSLPAWQAPSVPCTYAGFPSHVFGWPRMMHSRQGNAHHSEDPLVKEDNAGEHLQKIGNKQLQDTSQIVPGIPATRLGYVGSLEPNSNLNSKDVSPLAKFLSDEERGCTVIAVTEAGPLCNADSTTNDSQNILEREVGLELRAKPELESAIQARGLGLVSWHTAATPTGGDGQLMEKHSTFSAPEHMEGYMGLKVPLAVTRVPSCAASIGSMPMNGQGLASSWRLPHVTPTAAAEARKRRKELTRKKRLMTKASKLAV